jgi:hypothetical protein
MSLHRGYGYDYVSGSGRHRFSTSQSASHAASHSASRRPRPSPIGSASRGQASEIGSFRSGRPSEELYIERRDGRYGGSRGSGSSSYSAEPSASELRRRDAALDEEDRVREGRVRQWLGGSARSLESGRSFERSRPRGRPGRSRAGSGRRRTQSAAAAAVDTRSGRSVRPERYGSETSRREERWMNGRERSARELRRIREDRHYRSVFARRDVPGEREYARYIRTGGDPRRLPRTWRGFFGL